MVKTLEIETPDTAVEEQSPNTVNAETPMENKPPQLTQEQIIAASERKDQRLREINTERNNLEGEIAERRREANALRKDLKSVMDTLNTLITSDVAGFIKWEKEQELPLLQLAERNANAWRDLPVEKLDVTAADKEKLLLHFTRCGEVCDWLCLDFPDKKSGLNGEKTKDRLRDAINKISGVLENQTAQEEPAEEKESVDDFKKRVFDMLGDRRFVFAEETLAGIYEWVEENNHYTDDQKTAVENIADSVKD
jgi:hypothetical protein